MFSRRKIAFYLILCLCICAVSAHAFEVTIKSSVEKDDAKNVMRKTASLEMDNLGIFYKEGVRFGCPFGGHGSSGWGNWGFMSVFVKQPGEKELDPKTGMWRLPNIIAGHLEGPYLLEENEKGMVELVWFLDEKKENLLSVKIVKSPLWKNWFFMNIALEGKEFMLYRVVLRGYPGTTARKEKQERWVALQSGTYSLHKTSPVLEKKDFGIAFFSKYALENDGNLLILQPEKMKTARVSGIHRCDSDFTFLKDTRETSFAVGFFQGISYQKAIEKFLTTEAPEIQNALKEINWTVNANSILEKGKTIIAKIEGIKKESSDITAFIEKETEYKSCKTLFRESAKHSIREISEAVNKLKLIEKQVYKKYMEQVK